ncbi:hypothetical protein [Niallia sp. 03190]|uniref:hypothetical protein n=1 Tax=Niallia sp. 03190 TaxID=3458061 RepID=UPI004044B2D9
MQKGDSVTDLNGHAYFVHEIKYPFAKIGHYFKYSVSGEYVFKLELVHIKDLTPVELEGYSEEEIHFLMHLAVNTNDKEWFQELAKKHESLVK